MMGRTREDWEGRGASSEEGPPPKPAGAARAHSSPPEAFRLVGRLRGGAAGWEAGMEKVEFFVIENGGFFFRRRHS